MGDLRITTTPALIGIQATSGKLEIRQPKAEVELNIQHPKVEIRTEYGKIHIDQYQCFAEAGLKNFLDLTIENRAFAQRKFAQAVARIVRQGDEMVSELFRGTDMIAVHAAENALNKNKREFNMDTIPKSRPKIDFSGGVVDIHVIEGRVNPRVQINKPIIDFTRGKVDIYLRQRNSVNIEYVGRSLDKRG